MKTLLPRRLSAKWYPLFAFIFALITLGALPSWAIVVTTIADSGPGSLREAISTANGDGVATTITFDPVVFPPPPAAPRIILLTSGPLPSLTGTGDVIDGTGAAVVIDGSGLAGGIGLRVLGSNITVRGITIQNFSNDGIRVETPVVVATVTGVLVTGNNLIRNGVAGIRVTGRNGPGKTVDATITNNTILDSGSAGIGVRGNLRATGDPGSNQVTVLIDGNTVMRSKQAQGGGFGDEGIIIAGGVDDGSNNVVTAMISNNVVMQNHTHGIQAVGCDSTSAGKNNTVDVTVINNTVKENGLDSTAGEGAQGIKISGAKGTSPCAGNIVRFLISDNQVVGNKNGNIVVSGGPGTGHDVQGVILGNSAKDSPEQEGVAILGGEGTGNNLHDITISDNQVSGNFDRGIQIAGSGTDNLLTGIDILSNKVGRNGNQGIFVNGSTSQNATISNVRIDGNRSTRNGGRGIHVTLGSAINTIISLSGVTNNTVDSNADDGIFISSGIPGSGATPISGNRADRNGVDGIDINSTGYFLSKNRASRNAGDGINAVGNTNGGGNTGKGNTACNTPGCF